MKLRNDFYFWASWILLSCLILLVFYMYQEEFSLENFIDLKTILLVLGTVFGAYFGAKVAGQYAVSSVQKQIDFNKREEELKSKRVLQKKLTEVAVRALPLDEFLDNVLVLYEKLEQDSDISKRSSILANIDTFLEKEVTVLKSIDLTEVYGKPYFVINAILIHLEFILDTVKSLDEHLATGYQSVYSQSKESLYDSISELKKSLDSLKDELEKNI